jgi:hypothetical protein
VTSVDERVVDTRRAEDTRRTVRVRARGPARTRSSVNDRTEAAGEAVGAAPVEPLAAVVTLEAAAAAASSTLPLALAATWPGLVPVAGATLSQVLASSRGASAVASATAASTSLITSAVPKGSAARAVPGAARPPQTIAMIAITRPREPALRRAPNELDSLLRMLRSGSGRKIPAGMIRALAQCRYRPARGF